MIGMAVIFLLVTFAVAFVYGAWSAAGKEERGFVMKAIFKGAVFASIAFVILFVIVNLF